MMHPSRQEIQTSSQCVLDPQDDPVTPEPSPGQDTHHSINTHVPPTQLKNTKGVKPNRYACLRAHDSLQNTNTIRESSAL